MDDFDWALVEECVQFDECDLAQPFLAAGKAVFVVEYEGSIRDMCAGVPDGVTVIRKDIDVDAPLETCST